MWGAAEVEDRRSQAITCQQTMQKGAVAAPFKDFRRRKVRWILSAVCLRMQAVHVQATLSLEREAAMINDATLESTQVPGALDFDLQVQDMSKVSQSQRTPGCHAHK